MSINLAPSDAPADIAGRGLFGPEFERIWTKQQIDDSVANFSAFYGMKVFDVAAARPIWNVGGSNWVDADAVPIDWTAPTVVSISPANAASGVSASAPIVVTFSRPMKPDALDFVDPGPIWLLPTDGAATPVFPLAVTWSAGNTVATISPTAPLETGKTYKVIVATGSAGTPLGPTPRSVAGVAMAAPYEQAAGFTVA